jgi:AcrR family transcriptional regulator
MSIQGVAAAAGTSAPSLRRRYRDKLELAIATIDAMRTRPLPAKAKDPRAEILTSLRNMHDTMITGNGLAILATIVTEQTRHPELLAHFRHKVVAPMRARLRQALSAGMETGQLPAGLDLDTGISMLTGSLYAHYLNGQPLPEDWAERALHVIWPASPTRPAHLIGTRSPSKDPGPGQTRTYGGQDRDGTGGARNRLLSGDVPGFAG